MHKYCIVPLSDHWQTNVYNTSIVVQLIRSPVIEPIGTKSTLKLINKSMP